MLRSFTSTLFFTGPLSNAAFCVPRHVQDLHFPVKRLKVPLHFVLGADRVVLYIFFRLNV
jgi:hypothetical protein